uniref:Uncharacterized protein n=1 Tax=Saimiri boliviensis boliviensis TaxID=39432 RepID=A0A2K6V4R2_SAIBB
IASSAQLDFNLQGLLEQLSQGELSKFESLIRTISLERNKAEIFTSHCHSYWAGKAAIRVSEKMN